jgi:hypothetical protein
MVKQLIPLLGFIRGIRRQAYVQHLSFTFNMQKQIAGVIFATATAALMIGLSPMVVFAANSQEQVVFSGAAPGTFGGKQGIAAFWIWCKNTEGPNSHTYGTDCNGAMQFPALGISKGVTQEEGITEPSEGAYVIHVQSRSDNGQSVDCTLSNVPPITSGPTNTVNVHCASAQLVEMDRLIPQL